MRKWAARLCVLLLIALLIAAALYECSTHVVRGWLRGEAFYDGRPTSYWRSELDLWDVRRTNGLGSSINMIDPNRQFYFIDPRDENPFETSWKRWLRMPRPVDPKLRTPASMYGPRILQRDEAAGPVLHVLVEDPSPKIRCLARIGLGMNVEGLFGGE